MRRQVVIGGLVGIALGGLITFSFAHGFVGWPSDRAPAATPELQDVRAKDEPEAEAEAEVGSPAHRPLRPGSERAGKARAEARALAAVVPPSSDPSV